LTDLGPAAILKVDVAPVGKKSALNELVVNQQKKGPHQ
jgi:hypothetical protein